VLSRKALFVAKTINKLQYVRLLTVSVVAAAQTLDHRLRAVLSTNLAVLFSHISVYGICYSKFV